jgi:hypothetical protein
MATREQNERRFKNWQDTPDGKRRYWSDRSGAVGGFQRMIKVVDANETTLQVLQEIYNDDNVLIARHQKYPVDTGHEILVDED